MPRRQTRTISLSQKIDCIVTDEVASGHYSTASEVTRAWLRTPIEQGALDRSTPLQAGRE